MSGVGGNQETSFLESRLEHVASRKEYVEYHREQVSRAKLIIFDNIEVISDITRAVSWDLW